MTAARAPRYSLLPGPRRAAKMATKTAQLRTAQITFGSSIRSDPRFCTVPRPPEDEREAEGDESDGEPDTTHLLERCEGRDEAREAPQPLHLEFVMLDEVEEPRREGYGQALEAKKRQRDVEDEARAAEAEVHR